MALTLAKVKDSEDIWGKHRRVVFDVTFDNSYPAGGEVILPANVGLRRIEMVRIGGGNPAAGGLNAHWDVVAGKMMLLYPTGSTLAAPAAIADPILNAGAVAVTASAATGPFAAGRGKELAAGTDASAIQVRAEFIGE